MRIFRTSSSAFGLPEVLGATLIVLTIASVALYSVRDTLGASQRSAMQRELQLLNSSLSNFRGAGGLIEPGSSAGQAVDALMGGVKVEGSSYRPLTRRPPERWEVDGENYLLGYTDKDGFSYDPEGSEPAEIALPGNIGDLSFPFDISDEDAIWAAFQEFANMSPLDSRSQDYLDALNIIRDLKQYDVGDAMTNPNVYDINGTWTFPDPSYLMTPMSDDQWENFMRANYRLGGFDADFINETYGSEEGLQDYVRQVHGSWKNWAMPLAQNWFNTGTGENPILSAYTVPASAAQWASVTEKLKADAGPEYFFALSSMAHEGLVGSDWTNNVDWQKIPSLEGYRVEYTDFSGSNINGGLLNTIPVTNVTDSTMTVWGGTSNAAKNYGSLRGSVFTGLDLSGLDMNGRNVAGADFSSVTGLTADNLARSARLDQINLTGTGITRRDLEDAWVRAEKDLGSLPVNTIIFGPEPTPTSRPTPTPTPTPTATP
jgi:type II secretory pathway pseudopilin PulG